MKITLSFAFSRQKAQDLVSSKGVQVYLHLIKLLKWQDDLNYDKHIDDINTWLIEVSRIHMKPKGNIPSTRNYFDWLFGSYNSHSETNYTVKVLTSKYGNLPVLLTNEQLYERLNTVYQMLSIDLGTRQFEGIQKYL
jgi:hypothetical protein